MVSRDAKPSQRDDRVLSYEAPATTDRPSPPFVVPAMVLFVMAGLAALALMMPELRPPRISNTLWYQGEFWPRYVAMRVTAAVGVGLSGCSLVYAIAGLARGRSRWLALLVVSDLV